MDAPMARSPPRAVPLDRQHGDAHGQQHGGLQGDTADEGVFVPQVAARRAHVLPYHRTRPDVLGGRRQEEAADAARQ